MGTGQKPEIYTVYSDGSGVEAYRCDHGAQTAGGQTSCFRRHRVCQRHGLGRFTSALAEEVTVKAPTGEFAGDAAPVSTNEYLVAWRPDAKSRYSVQLWNSKTGAMSPGIASNDADSVQPVLVAPTAIAQSTSFRPARLELRQLALPECLHVEVQVCAGECGVQRSCTPRRERASRNCWEARRSSRMARFT